MSWPHPVVVRAPTTGRAIGSSGLIAHSTRTPSGNGKHRVSLDEVIKTMRDTGRGVKDKHEETSRDGLAVNAIEC